MTIDRRDAFLEDPNLWVRTTRALWLATFLREQNATHSVFSWVEQ